MVKAAAEKIISHHRQAVEGDKWGERGDTADLARKDEKKADDVLSRHKGYMAGELIKTKC